MILALALFAGLSFTEEVVVHEPIILQSDDVRFARIRNLPGRTRIVLRRPRFRKPVVVVEQIEFIKKKEKKK
jgi:hypothetical protein